MEWKLQLFFLLNYVQYSKLNNLANTLLILPFYLGTTWLQEIVWQIHNEGIISNEKILVRVPFLELALNENIPSTDLKTLPSPRLIKSHLSYKNTPKSASKDAQCQYIYVARNPKDVAVSYFLYMKLLNALGNGYNGPWEFFLKLFMEGNGEFD